MTDIERQLIELNGLSEADFEPLPVSQADRTEAQALYTALMTDTLLEE